MLLLLQTSGEHAASNTDKPILQIMIVKKIAMLSIILIVLVSLCVNGPSQPLGDGNKTPPQKTPGTISSVPIAVPNTSACAITSPPQSMEGINTHTELYGAGADPNIITLGPKEGGRGKTYEHKCGMSFEAYNRGSPVLAPFDMVLVGFRDTSNSYQIVPGEIGRAHV